MNPLPPSAKPAPNPAIAAFLRSTTWKLLLAADGATAVGGAVGYYLTNNLLAFAPFAMVAATLVFSLYRVIAQGAGPSSDGDDPIVR